MEWIARGFRSKIEKYFSLQEPITVRLEAKGDEDCAFALLALGAGNVVVDERYWLSSKRLASPEGSLRILEYSAQAATLQIDLSKLPPHFPRVLCIVAVEGLGSMSQLQNLQIEAAQGGTAKLAAVYNGSDFVLEKTLIGLEFYLKDKVWRMAFLGQGFSFPLTGLLSHFGGTKSRQADLPEEFLPAEQRASKVAPAPAPQTQPIAPSQEPQSEGSGRKKGRSGSIKDCTTTVPPLGDEFSQALAGAGLSDLSYPFREALRQYSLPRFMAQVALVVDASGSMFNNFADGTVMELANRVMPLAAYYDPQQSLDLWYFGGQCRRRPPLKLETLANAVPRDWEQMIVELGFENNEPLVMRQVIEKYRQSQVPIIVVLASDGGVTRNEEILEVLYDSLDMPLLWLFLGINGTGFGVLEEVSTYPEISERAYFLELPNLKSFPIAKLYDFMAKSIAQWMVS